MGVADKLDDYIAQMGDLDVPWGFDLEAVLGERTRQAPGANEAADGTAEKTGWSQGGVVGAPSAPAGRVNSDPSATSTADTDQRNGADSPTVCHKLGDY